MPHSQPLAAGASSRSIFGRILRHLHNSNCELSRPGTHDASFSHPHPMLLSTIISHRYWL